MIIKGGRRAAEHVVENEGPHGGGRGAQVEALRSRALGEHDAGYHAEPGAAPAAHRGDVRPDGESTRSHSQVGTTN